MLTTQFFYVDTIRKLSFKFAYINEMNLQSHLTQIKLTPNIM